MTKPKKPSGITASAAQIVEAEAGLRALIEIEFPVEISTEFHEKLQAVRIAATPLQASRDALVKAYAKRKGGQIVYGSKPGEIVLDPNRVGKFNAEYAKWAAQQRLVAVEPIRRAEIPHKVDGKDVILAGKVFERLGPFLVP